MKTQSLQNLVLTLTTVAAVTLLSGNAAGQESSTSTTATTATPAATQPAATPPAAAEPAATSQAAPELSYGVEDVVQLVHANVGDDIVINYVENSGNGYGLNAKQILYLKQQGVSDRVINAMVAQRSRLAEAQTGTPQNSPDTGDAPIATVVTQPTVTYAQPAQSSTVYIIPDTQTYHYYAYHYYPYFRPQLGFYSWPSGSFSFGYRGYYGGYRGGWRGGGGWHYGGGGFRGGGGFHGRGVFHGGGRR